MAPADQNYFLTSKFSKKNMSYQSSRQDLADYRKILAPTPKTKHTTSETKTEKKKLKKDYRHQLASAIARLTALKHPEMRKILRAIAEEPKTVYEIQEAAELKAQPLTSQHLGLLRASMLVRWERQGKHIYYYADVEEIERCNESVMEFNLS